MLLKKYFVGIDGCKAGWFFIEIGDDGHFQFGVLNRFDQIKTFENRTKLILVDVPIGLLDKGRLERKCDTEARQAISPRGSTVFPSPARQALAMDSYATASEQNFRSLGRRLSRQSFAIIPKIREVDDFIQQHDGDLVIREMHPEVAFWALNFKRPLLTRKKSKEGIEDRLALLSRHYDQARDCFEEARKLFKRSEVANDDIVDAMVGAVTARYPDYLKTLPANPARDECGLPMEMVYADLKCVFCSPSSNMVFFENQLVQCIWDAYPVSPGHALIIPRRHVETLFEASSEEKEAMFAAIDKAREVIEKKHNPTAYNIGINSGRDAGQTVPHLHLHVIPRYRDDIDDPRGGIRNVLPSKAKYWEQS